jgi:hypothetical protein
MAGFSDFPDPDKGRAMFESAYGPVKGRERFRFVLRILIPLGVLTLIGGLLLANGRIYSEVKGWFSTTSQTPIDSGSSHPSRSGNCTVSGGTNNGRISQTCR